MVMGGGFSVLYREPTRTSLSTNPPALAHPLSQTVTYHSVSVCMRLPSPRHAIHALLEVSGKLDRFQSHSATGEEEGLLVDKRSLQ